MRWELNQATFARLVQLYLLLFGLTVGTLVYEAISPSWSAFSDSFDALVDVRFGAVPESIELAAAMIGLACLTLHVAAAFELLRYKRWARTSFWASLLILVPLSLTPVGWEPTFEALWWGWLDTAGSALLGAIILLSYSRDHGAAWFMTPLERLKETF